MKKREKEYLQKYGLYSKNFVERLQQLVSDLRPSNSDMKKIRKYIPKLLMTKWEKVDFTIYMEPKATPRPRENRSRGIFYVKYAADNLRLFKEFLDSDESYNYTIVTPTKIFCDVFMPIPSSMTKIEKILAELGLLAHVSNPDWDNLAKTYCDMIQGKFILNDSIIFDGRTRKRYSTKPRIEVHIEFMEEFDCKYNRKKVLGWNRPDELNIYTDKCIMDD